MTAGRATTPGQRVAYEGLLLGLHDSEVREIAGRVLGLPGAIESRKDIPADRVDAVLAAMREEVIERPYLVETRHGAEWIVLSSHATAEGARRAIDGLTSWRVTCRAAAA